jgi:hypothetical protein
MRKPTFCEGIIICISGANWYIFEVGDNMYMGRHMKYLQIEKCLTMGGGILCQ